MILLISSFIVSDADAKRRRFFGFHDFTKDDRYASLVVDAQTGDVLYQKNAHAKLYPASLTKVMTLYLAFEALEDGRLTYTQQLPVSTKASLMPKTKLFLRAGQKITVRDAILGLIIHSANDAAVVLAEAIDGSEEKFAKRMTIVAHQLGMKDTTFKNASGLPDTEQKTSAYDLVRLGIAVRRDFPKYYPLFSKKSFIYNGRVIAGHNRVLSKYEFADGLKTGFTNASGFNLLTSASKKDGILVAAVLGGSSAVARDNHMIQLLDYGYKKLDEVKLARNTRSIFNQLAKTEEQEKVRMTKRPQTFIVASTSVFEAIEVSPVEYISADQEKEEVFEEGEFEEIPLQSVPEVRMEKPQLVSTKDQPKVIPITAKVVEKNIKTKKSKKAKYLTASSKKKTKVVASRKKKSKSAVAQETTKDKDV
ncbi:MAG: D-alanyl-D-alanine carboxypeptidase family protein [Rickettsiales bacterium]